VNEYEIIVRLENGRTETLRYSFGKKIWVSLFFEQYKSKDLLYRGIKVLSLSIREVRQ
jgi:hypothetical protein